MDNPLPEKWRIIRQDSGGNRFIEHEHLSEIAAQKFVDTREKMIGDHHQTVWKQKMSEDAPYPHWPVASPV